MFRKSVGYLQTIFNSVQTGLVIIDAETHRIADVNDVAARMIGTDKQAIIGSLCHHFICPAEIGKCPITDLGMTVDNSERMLIKANSDKTPIIKTVTSITVDGRNYLLESFVDITKHKREEEEKRQKLSRAVEHSSASILITDTQGTIEYVNQKFSQITGYTQDEVIGKNWSFLKSPETPPEEYTHLWNTITFGGEWKGEFCSKKKNGEIYWEVATVSPVTNEVGVITNFVVVKDDITERKRSQESLREQEATLRTITTSARDAIIMIDHQGWISFWNTAAERMLGWKAEEVLGRELHLLIAPESYHAAYRLGLKKFQDTGQGNAVGKTLELSAIRKDKIEIPVELSLSAVQLGGQWHAVGIMRDITDRKREEEVHKALEERLQRAEKMEALGTLAGGVAHDLNNVIGILVGYSEMVLDEMDPSSPIRSYIMNIMTGGERAAAIVQDLLTMARRGVLTGKVINLNTTIMDYQKTLEYEKLSSSHPNAQIKNIFEDDLLNIMGSPVHIGKTIMNLVSNAVEAMPNGGLVTLTTSNQYLDRPLPGYDDVREGDYVVLSVSDTGEGISPTDINHIFEPFYTKKVMGRSGTGLGLAVVWGTVKDHNGYINVQSEKGKGTTFTLYFPVTRENLPEDSLSVPVAEYRGRGESILVVDDIKEQRELAVGMLAKLNYKTAATPSGEEAVEYLKDHKADLVVLDMIMDPGMDGLDTYKQILDILPKQKAVIVSGYSETDRVNEVQMLGAGTYVRKPYVLEKLGLAVRKELDK